MSIERKYAYSTTFHLDGESALDDLWSYVIFRLNIENSEYTYDRFARLYNLLCEFKKSISVAHSIQIVLTESSEKYYVLVKTDIHPLLKKFTARLSALNFPFTQKNDVLEYSIDKKMPIQNVPKTTYNYSFVSQDDIYDMSNILERMEDKNYEQLVLDFTKAELDEYRTTFSYYSSHLTSYPEFIIVNNIVAELSVLLSLYTNECLESGNDFRLLLKSFLNNLIFWQNKLFVDRDENINFMDNSLKADLEQIKVILNLYDTVEENDSYSLDDIFNF